LFLGGCLFDDRFAGPGLLGWRTGHDEGGLALRTIHLAAGVLGADADDFLAAGASDLSRHVGDSRRTSSRKIRYASR
jgi:hypothetical protein